MMSSGGASLGKVLANIAAALASTSKSLELGAQQARETTDSSAAIPPKNNNEFTVKQCLFFYGMVRNTIMPPERWNWRHFTWLIQSLSLYIYNSWVFSCNPCKSAWWEARRALGLPSQKTSQERWRTTTPQSTQRCSQPCKQVEHHRPAGSIVSIVPHK